MENMAHEKKVGLNSRREKNAQRKILCEKRKIEGQKEYRCLDQDSMKWQY